MAGGAFSYFISFVAFSSAVLCAASHNSRSSSPLLFPLTNRLNLRLAASAISSSFCRSSDALVSLRFLLVCSTSARAFCISSSDTTSLRSFSRISGEGATLISLVLVSFSFSNCSIQLSLYSAYFQPSDSGGPVSTQGWSPTVRSYSRTSILEKDTRLSNLTDFEVVGFSLCADSSSSPNEGRLPWDERQPFNGKPSDPTGCGP
mmetsp:Transcript_7436/g.11259  ORF Transcript_7436/g.11259 Transcript_7436/m.11259 type:complete len:204 (+) Transcript_7436:150-761(+)